MQALQLSGPIRVSPAKHGKSVPTTPTTGPDDLYKDFCKMFPLLHPIGAWLDRCGGTSSSILLCLIQRITTLLKQLV